MGGDTLKLFTKCLADGENKDILIVQKQVKILLLNNFGFSELYAEWLPKHLQHLTSGSIMILEDLKDKDFDKVFYSTVVSINSEKERNTFENNILILVSNSARWRRNILDSGVIAS